MTPVAHLEDGSWIGSSQPLLAQRDVRFLPKRTSIRSQGWTGEQLTIQVPYCWLLPLLQNELRVKQENCCDTTAPTCSYLKRGNSQIPFGFLWRQSRQLRVSRAVSSQGTHCTPQSCFPACVLSHKLDLTQEELSYVLSL